MRPRAALVLALVLPLVASGRVSAQTGNTERQEKGDIEWRVLQILVDFHSALYETYTIGDPRNKANHLLNEMEGPAERIRTITLANFEDTLGAFHGAHTAKDPSTGGPRIMLRPLRQDFVAMGRTLANVGGIDYVPSALSDYIVFDTLGDNNRLDPTEIVAMRSDAFTEYIYTANGVPIVTLDGQTIITNPARFEEEASLTIQKLLPSWQKGRMVSSVIEPPSVEVMANDGTLIPDGGVSPTTNISVRVVDLLSGPGRLEVWEDAVDEGTLVGKSGVSR